MKLKKSIRKKINIAIIVVVVIAVLGIMYLGYKRFFTKTPAIVKPKVVDTIKDYGYELEEGQTALYKKLYNEYNKSERSCYLWQIQILTFVWTQI